MRDFDETNITAAVLEQLMQCSSPRTAEISMALVRHLHDFIREIEPTPAEWESAIQFLTDTGQMCTATRQEFVLLSDTLGASMLVDAINHRRPGGVTETTVLGPFYVESALEMVSGSDISGGDTGRPLRVEGSVHRLGGEPIEGALIETWHSDANGYYDVQKPAGIANLTHRARLRSDVDGKFWYRSIVPAHYPIPDDGPVGRMLSVQGRHPFRPAHIHFIISAPGLKPLVTHLFLEGSPYLDSDVVFGVKNSLIQTLTEESSGTDGSRTSVLRYNFVLADADPCHPSTNYHGRQ